jgi:3-phosphoshikimate 1-carboxyvinyltransferase
MPLPDLIEIVPLIAPVRAEITVPGSKSITNRALILAALADGEVTLKGALWSEDTEIMFDCLQKLGFEVSKQDDPDELCNRTITVKGLGGKIPRGGTAEKPLELFVGNAGTAARFLSAFVCLGDGVYRLSGVARMHERPQAALFSALRELGYRVESENGNDKLPVRISHRGTENTEEIKSGSVRSVPLWQKKCKVSIEESSQFASALLLSAGVGNWQVEVVGENAEESPYVAMTSKLIEAFPKNGGTFQIEPDASSGSYFWAANEILRHDSVINQIAVHSWPNSGMQIDENFPKIFPLQKNIVRGQDLGDAVLTAFITALFESKPIEFSGLAPIRLQECDRLFAMKLQLSATGSVALSGVAPIQMFGFNELEALEKFKPKLAGELQLSVPPEHNSIVIFPSASLLRPAEIDTYNDHRMAMCFAILGLKVPGIKIKNPACVKKTFPNFFQKLAAQPPHGLGAEIWEIKDGQRTRKLSGDDLFAD